jgi:K+/H+ antiporter YhaU regulatory subunit KhtT
MRRCEMNGKMKMFTLQRMDREFALQAIERAQDSLRDVALILGRRRVKKGDLLSMYPAMTKIMGLLLTIQEMDLGAGGKS